MPFQQVSFQVPRVSDRFVVDRLRDALSSAGFAPGQFTLSLLIGGDLNSHDSGQAKQIDAILELDTIAARSVSFEINNQGTVSVRRPEENHRLKGWYDDATLNPGKETDATRMMTLIRETRKSLRAIEEKTALDFLSEEQRAYYEARDVTLQRQEQMVQRFFTDLQTFSADLTKTLTVRFRQKEAALEEEHAKRMVALDKQIEKRTKDLDERESELEQRKKEIDDRESKHVRREIYREIRSKFVERSKSFALTQGTRRLRIPIYVSSLGLLMLLLIGVVYYVFVDSPWNRQENLWALGWAIARQVLLTAGFALTAWFIIRWQNKWFHNHAEEEFRLKRLELDIDRASWVVEMAMEWKDAKGTEIPQFLVERLSRNLFEQDSSSEVVTPVDSLTAAVRAASGTKVRLGDIIELSFDPNSIKRLEKEGRK